jgi:hypothetical protein
MTKATGRDGGETGRTGVDMVFGGEVVYIIKNIIYIVF